MPDRRDPPPTDEGWYVLHDFRAIDWDRWRETPERDRQRDVEEAVDFLDAALAVEDADEGGSALYSVLGHEADVLVLHMRPATADIGALERQFERTAFARYTERTSSFVSVTEASGYSERARDYFEGDLDESSGLYNYIQTRLKPTIPDATHVCFYPMDKRRQPEQNWYDLPFEERAEHMDAHGDIGRDYGGKVTQMITGAIAIDDWEWGVTLWGDDLTDMKDLLYEMRFDPSTAQYADFGDFFVGRRFPPSDLPAFLAGERVPTDGTGGHESTAAAPAHPADADEESPGHGDGESAADGDGATAAHSDEPTAADHDGGEPANDDGVETADHDGGEPNESQAGEESGGGPPGGPPGGDHDVSIQVVDDMATRLKTLGLDPGTDFGAGDYAVVLNSEADAQPLAEEVTDLRGDFEHYDSHVGTMVRAQGGHSAVVSVWNAERAADIAEGFLTDLSGITQGVRGPLDAEGLPERTADESAGGDEGGADAHGEAGDGHDEGADAHGGSERIREELADLDIYAGKPHGEDVYALVLYSEADLSTLVDEVEDLSTGFDRYDTHEGTTVYEDPDSDVAAVVSLWETEDAADTASGYLSDLPAVVGWAGEGEGFGTMGMFYTVKPDHRSDFVEKFDTVGDLLSEMEGHRETALLVNHEDDTDMFIASQWESKADAMEFFRSDAFSETVDWGRDVLADRPRHVFLA